MGYVGLLLSGAALFLNSLVILGKAEMKSAGVFNLFVGALQIIIPFYLIMISDQSNWTVYSYAATFLFGLTYLYVGVTFIKGMDSSGLGWFCIWVAIIALFYMVVSFVQFNDVVNALTWFMWALLWYLFFVLNTQKEYQSISWKNCFRTIMGNIDTAFTLLFYGSLGRGICI